MNRESGAKATMVRKWLVKADSDLRSARFLRQMPDEEMTTDTICFHCQQAIEKALKAFLVWNDVDFRKEHNLEYLHQLCKRSDPLFHDFDYGRISEYGVTVRYPAEFYVPTVEEADVAIDTAESVMRYVPTRLPNLAAQ